MGIELLQEASNVAALQQMYRTMGFPWQGPLPPHPGLQPGLVSAPGLPASVSPGVSSLDLFYRQAAAAHSLQRPFPYKLSSPGSVGGGTPLPPSHPGPLLPLPQLPQLPQLAHAPLSPGLAHHVQHPGAARALPQPPQDGPGWIQVLVVRSPLLIPLN